MHVTTREVVTDKDKAKELGVDVGCHILTSVVEADGPFELASDKAKFDAEVISVKRTAGGGVEIQTAFHIQEPAPEAPVAPPAPEEIAVAYLVSKKMSQDKAKAAVARYGAQRVLDRKADEEKNQESALDEELDDMLGIEKPEPAPPAA